jgi:hypothetical protein
LRPTTKGTAEKEQAMLIVFEGDSEVIVCTPETEEETIKEYLTNTGRYMDDYNRFEFESAVIVEPVMRAGDIRWAL